MSKKRKKSLAGQPLRHCNMFKSLLQESCQKVGLKDPVYIYTKDGPDHAPRFTASVCINTVIYKSAEPKPTRHEAEQNCAKVALPKIYGVEHHQLNIAQMLIDAGLCKTMLQEYAQRMGWPLPKYECKMHMPVGMRTMYFASVICGDIKYEGPCGRNTKHAKMNVAIYACAQIMASFPGNAGNGLPLLAMP